MLKKFDTRVIPAKARIQWCSAGFRVKPGMTNSVRSSLFIMTAY